MLMQLYLAMKLNLNMMLNVDDIRPEAAPAAVVFLLE